MISYVPALFTFPAEKVVTVEEELDVIGNVIYLD